MIHAGLRYAFSPIPSCLDKTAFILVIFIDRIGLGDYESGLRMGAPYSYTPEITI